VGDLARSACRAPRRYVAGGAAQAVDRRGFSHFGPFEVALPSCGAESLRGGTFVAAAVVTLGAMAIVLGLVLSAYIVFQLEFSLISLLAVDGLAILAAVIGAVCLSRARPPDKGRT
jgi:hypothetical protein